MPIPIMPLSRDYGKLRLNPTNKFVLAASDVSGDTSNQSTRQDANLGSEIKSAVKKQRSAEVDVAFVPWRYPYLYYSHVRIHTDLSVIAYRPAEPGPFFFCFCFFSWPLVASPSCGQQTSARDTCPPPTPPNFGALTCSPTWFSTQSARYSLSTYINPFLLCVYVCVLFAHPPPLLRKPA